MTQRPHTTTQNSRPIGSELPDDAERIENLLPLYDTGGLGYFGYRMALAARLFDRRIAQLLRQHGRLTLPQWRVIAQLGLVGTGTVRSLAEGAAVDRAEVSRSLRCLIDQGVVRRRVNEADHRQPTFALTEQGGELYLKVKEPISLFIANLVAQVPSVDLEAADRVLLTVTKGAVRGIATLSSTAPSQAPSARKR